MSDIQVTEADRSAADAVIKIHFAAPGLHYVLRYNIALAIATARREGYREAYAACYPMLPEGGIIDCTGETPVVRKVCPRHDGTVPPMVLTGDGCVISPESFVWVMPPHCANPGGMGFAVIELSSKCYTTSGEGEWSDTYSTREAAEAARGGGE